MFEMGPFYALKHSSENHEVIYILWFEFDSSKYDKLNRIF